MWTYRTWSAALEASVFALVMSAVKPTFNLTIMHPNDILCRFEETNKYGGTCTSEDAVKGQRYGCYARRLALSLIQEFWIPILRKII